MHICFIGNMLGRNPGYITTQGEILADLFLTKGYQVTCVSKRINRLFRLLEVLVTLLWARSVFDIVVIDCFSGRSFIIADVAGLICKWLRLQAIIFLRGGNFPTFVSRYPRWVSRVLRRSDVLVAPSHFLARTFRERGFAIDVVPNVIDIDRYQYHERSSLKPKLLWMRSFHEIYNPEMAVSVLHQLKRTHPDATLVMAGPDKGRLQNVRQMINELDLSDSIRLVGFLDLAGKTREFSEAEIYLNTNRIDNMPVSVIEARAFGVPVVSTDVGGLTDVIVDGTNGLLVRNEDVDGMANAIRRLLADPSLTQQISKAGRQCAELCAWDSVHAQWEELFRRLMKAESVKRAALTAN